MITLCLAPPGTGVTHDSRGRHGAASVSNPRPGSGFRVRRRGRAHQRAKGVGETPAWPSVARRGLWCPRERAWLPSLRSCAQHVPSLCFSRKRSSGCNGLESASTRLDTCLCRRGHCTHPPGTFPSQSGHNTWLALGEARPAPEGGTPAEGQARRPRPPGHLSAPTPTALEGAGEQCGAGLRERRVATGVSPHRRARARESCGEAGSSSSRDPRGSVRRGTESGRGAPLTYQLAQGVRVRVPVTPAERHGRAASAPGLRRPRLLPHGPGSSLGCCGAPSGAGSPGGGVQGGGRSGVSGGAEAWARARRGRGGVLEGAGSWWGRGGGGPPEGSAARARAAPRGQASRPGGRRWGRARILLLSGQGAALLGASCAPL